MIKIEQKSNQKIYTKKTKTRALWQKMEIIT